MTYAEIIQTIQFIMTHHPDNSYRIEIKPASEATNHIWCFFHKIYQGNLRLGEVIDNLNAYDIPYTFNGQYTQNNDLAVMIRSV